MASIKTGSEYSYILPELALEYILLGDYKHAIQYADEGLQLAHNNGDSLLLVRSAKVKASALRRSGKTDSAKFLFNQILPISKRNSYDFETEIILNSLASIYTAEAHYDTALWLEAEHLEKENQIKIGFQNRMLLLNKEVIFRQRMINVFIGVVTRLVVILAIVLAKSNQQKRKANEILDEKVKKRTRDLEVSRNTLQRTLDTQDARMHKLSTDIKNSIATIKALCSLGLKDIDHPNAHAYLTKVDSVSDHIFEGLNRTFYSHGLDTP